MCITIREEFCWSRFALRFHKKEAFCEAQWRWPRLVFVLYRVLMAAYSIFAFTHQSVISSDSDFRHHFMVYLTNWTYLVEMLFFFWGAVLAVCCFFWPRCFQSLSSDAGSDVERQAKAGVDNPVLNTRETGGKNIISPGISPTSAAKPSSPETTLRIRGSEDSGGSERRGAVALTSLPWYIQVYWVLSNIIQDAAFVVTVVYFSALYSPSQGISLQNLNVHAINSVMILIDVLLCARPVRLLHVVYPILYGFVYVIFSVIYWSQDHENNVLYNVLDWNHPGLTCAMVFGLALLAFPLLQLGHYGIYRLRLWCYQRLYGESYLLFAQHTHSI